RSVCRFATAYRGHRHRARIRAGSARWVMQARAGLLVVLGFLLLSMIGGTSWASGRQPVWEWGGLTQPPDNAWTIATLFDAYYGFITFYVWLAYKERRWLPRIGWLVALFLLGKKANSPDRLLP